jgi:O-antigen ligase
MTLLKIARFFTYLAVMSIGIVLTSTFFPFIGGKYFFFRFMVELGVIFVLLSWAFEDSLEVERRLKNLIRQPIFLALSVFVLVFLLACLFAYDSHAAFWSNFERGEGGFQMIHYYLFFCLMALLLDRKEEWFTLFKVSLAAGAFMVFYGLAAAAGWDGFVGPYNNVQGSIWKKLAGERFHGSLGNPAYVAPYILFSMFYAIWLWWSSRKTLVLNVLYGVLTVFFLGTFLLAQTRGAFLGLLAALAAFFAHLIWSHGGKMRMRALAVLAVVAVLFGTLFYFRESPAIQKLPGSRLLTISFSADAAQTRLWTWGSAIKGFKERPILGWGPENFTTVFDKYFDTRHYVPGVSTETWFDRAHSIVFDYLAETGIVGLLAYLGVFAAYYWTFWRKFLRRAEPEAESVTRDKNHFGIHESAFLRSLLFAIPVAYFVQGLVLFDVLPIFLNWMVVLAFATVLYQQKPYVHNV